MRDGTRVRLTAEATYIASRAAYRVGDVYLGSTMVAGFTVEMLSEPLDPEPPVGSVVLDRDGDAWQRRRSGWYAPGAVAETWESLNEVGPLTVIHDTGSEK